MTVTEKINDLDTFFAQISGQRDFEGLSKITITRGGVPLSRFTNGFIDAPSRKFNRRGSGTPISGLGFNGNLKRYRTPLVTIEEETVEDALTLILANSPFTVGDVDTFLLQKNPFEFTTALELAVWDYNDMGLDFDVTIEGDTELDTGANSIFEPLYPYKTCFFDGTYKFHTYEDGGNIKYRAIDKDGTIAAEVDLLIATGGFWTIHLVGSDVFLINFDGANTDVYSGTIAGSTITLALVDGNAIVGAFIDTQLVSTHPTGKLYMAAGRNLYRSIDAGVTWVNVWTTDAPQETIKALFVASSDDDLYMVIEETTGPDVEEWLFDDSILDGTFTRNIDGIFTGSSVLWDSDQNGDHSMHLVYEDDTDIMYAYKTEAGVSWTLRTIEAVAAVQEAQVCADSIDGAYVAWNQGAGLTITKFVDGVLDSELFLGTVASGVNFCGPGNHDTNIVEVAFFSYIDGGGDVHDLQLDVQDIHLIGGVTEGDVTTTDIVGDGDFVKWGVAAAILRVPQDITFEVQDGVGVELVPDLSFDADLDAEGVPDTETTIQLQIFFDQSGADIPAMSALFVSERWTKIEELTFDNERLDLAIRKIEKFLGMGEWDLNSDFTVDFVEELGTDKSGVITLQRGVNLQDVKVDRDFRTFANVQQAFGAGTAGVDRIEVELRDSVDIAARVDGSDDGQWYAEPIRDQDMTTLGIAYSRASAALARKIVEIQRASVTFLDTFNLDLIGKGDKVMVVDPRTGLTSALRIKQLQRTWSRSGEKVTAQLSNRIRVDETFAFLAEVNTIKRQL